jgi:hypothetical protein
LVPDRCVPEFTDGEHQRRALQHAAGSDLDRVTRTERVNELVRLSERQ